jgi:hypothetical protein
VTVSRKRAVERQRIETPGGRVILGTFGPDGSDGWDLWVPAALRPKAEGGPAI